MIDEVGTSLTPEDRQPLSRFSRDLRERQDCQRYVFRHAIWPGRRLPVHVLFSPALEQAEVAFGDRKPTKIAPVSSADDARRRWVEGFESRRGREARSRGSAGPAGG